MSKILHSPSPNALESRFYHHPVLERGYHLAGSNNTPRMSRSTVSAIKNARISRGSNTIPEHPPPPRAPAAALRAPEPLH
jgi:hypothetical protein